MKRLIVLSAMMAVMFLTGGSVAPACAQDSAKDDTPTFYHLVPGTYVNGWPRFTIHYPKEWVERQTMPGETFRVSAPGPVPSPAFVYALLSNAPPLDKFADLTASFFKTVAKDVTIISDKPSRLRDGTPAREIELRMLINGAPRNVMSLAAQKGDVMVHMLVESPNGRIGEDLKAILYSIEFQPDKDKPVKVPPDFEAFVEMHMSNRLSHDLAKVMANYSDRYLNSGTRKGEMERWLRPVIDSWMSAKAVWTDFVPAGDKAYVAGFVVSNFGTFQVIETCIIKENGEWKLYGNQREVVP